MKLRTKNVFMLTACAMSLQISLASAQDVANPVPSSPQTQTGQAGGASGSSYFPGYVPSAASGMGAVGISQENVSSDPNRAAEHSGAEPKSTATATAAATTPVLNDGKQVNSQKVDAFNTVIENTFPMTPEMIRRMRSIYDENQKALLDKSEPNIVADSSMLSLEPGETAPTVYLSPGVSTVIGVYDSTGQSWPITLAVVGNKDAYQLIQLGKEANNVTVTPLIPIGWTNLILTLKDEPKPVMVRLEVSNSVAHYRKDIQITKRGPNAQINTVSEMPQIKPLTHPETDEIRSEAGTPVLMAALSGVDLPDSAVPVKVFGVNARAWTLGKKMIVRTKSPLISPGWSNSLAGPDGVYVYEIPQVSTALFSVNGAIVRADVELP